MNKKAIEKIKEEKKDNVNRWTVHILDSLNEEEIKQLKQKLEEVLG